MRPIMTPKQDPTTTDPILDVELLIPRILETISDLSGHAEGDFDTRREHVEALWRLAENIPELTDQIEALNGHLDAVDPDELWEEVPELLEQLENLTIDADELAGAADRQAQSLFWDHHEEEDAESIEAVNDAVDCLTAAITELRSRVNGLYL
jgi:hypothetical protein